VELVKVRSLRLAWAVLTASTLVLVWGCSSAGQPEATVVGSVAEDGTVCVLHDNWLGSSSESHGTVLAPPVPVTQQSLSGTFRRTGERTGEFRPAVGPAVHLDGHDRSETEQNVACAIR
jgi:hypothetical protein